MTISGSNRMNDFNQYKQNINMQDLKAERTDARFTKQEPVKIIRDNETSDKKQIPSPNGEGSVIDFRV